MPKAERLKNIVEQLVDGWNEKIEYSVWVGSAVEKRVERRWQAGLVDQLLTAQYLVPCKGSDGSGGGGAVNKPASKTPGNLEQPDELLAHIEVVVREALGPVLAISGHRRLKGSRLKIALSALDGLEDHEAREDAAHRLALPVRRARMMLGYDSRSVAFESTVCGDCGGALVVAEDAPTAVRCGGTPASPPCGVTYPWYEWPDLALAAVDRMADTTVAVEWIGRPREVLYRWAREGRVTRHGGSGRNDARWNLGELPRAIPGRPLPDPPPKRIKAAGLDKTVKA